MSEPKTKLNDNDVHAFIQSVENEERRKDSEKLVQIFAEVTGEEPKMWGTSIVGFGSYHYKYASGKEADWMATGFSPRQQNMSLYLMNGFDDYEEELSKLGPHKTAKSCLYIKRLSDVDEKVLRNLIKQSVTYVTEVMDES